jgi:23S rRNA (cytidine2498-2'-O)-methyltransferase
MPPHARFVYALAQPEAKAWLLKALERTRPELRLAYSRPGLYSFKAPEPGLSLDFRLQVPFVRHDGFSLGVVNDVAMLAELIEPLGAPLRLHLFARDAGESKPRAARPTIDECRDNLLEQFPKYFAPGVTPVPGDWVLDVVLPPDAAGLPRGETEAWFVGYHRHDVARSPQPGSVSRRDPPLTAPSRAWSKIEEAIEWGCVPVRAGDVAVEIGCAPGGAVMALVDRGLQVVGVDPAAMDPGIVEHCTRIGASFRHLAQPLASVSRDLLPARVDWLLSDANLAPQVVIRSLAHWCRWLRPHLRGVVFTMKLNDERVADAVPQLIARVAEFGLGEPRAVQLPSHRREIVVIADRKRH